MYKINRKTLKKIFNSVTSIDSFDGASVLSFYFLLSVFPAIIIFLKLSSIIYFNTDDSSLAVDWFSRVPSNLKEIFIEVVTDTRKSNESSLWSITYLIGLWTVLNGVSAVIRQLNMVHNIEESRSYINLKLRALFISILFVLLIFGTSIASFLGSYVIQIISSVIEMNTVTIFLINLVRYLILAFVPFGFFVIVYYFGANKKNTLKCVIPGSLAATITFILFTQAFSFYLKNFSNYSATYGSIGAVVGLVTWLYFTGFILIAGEVLNKEL